MNLGYKKNIIAISLYSIILAYFLCLFTNHDFKAFSLKLNNVEGNVNFELPCKDAYLLAIWNPDPPTGVYFNGKRIAAARVSKRKDYTLYFVLSSNDVRGGSNNLKIAGQGKYSLKIKNYIAVSKFSNIFVLNKSSRFLAEKKFDFTGFYIYVFFIAVFLIVGWLITSFLDSSIVISIWLSLIPCVLFYIILGLVELATPYKVVLNKHSCIGLTLFLAGIVVVPVVFLSTFKKFKAGFYNEKIKFLQERKYSENKLFESIFAGIINIIIKVIAIVFSYVLKDSTNSFIVVFMFLLFFSFFLLIFKLDVIAEIVINFGYIALLTGVSLKFLEKIKNRLC